MTSPAQSPPSPAALRRRALAPVPRVRGQQQREALRHLRLQRLQRLLQEEREAAAHLQVRQGSARCPPAPEGDWEGWRMVREEGAVANMSEKIGRAHV